MEDLSEVTEFEERMAEAQAQIESLQATAADAEARAATAQAEAAALRQRTTKSESALEAAHSQVRESAVLYRTARLAAAPEVPPELVSERDTVEEVEREFEAALRVVEAMRERLRAEGKTERQIRVPPGAPVRRKVDTSSLPASEKIRIGLQRLSEREGR